MTRAGDDGTDQMGSRGNGRRRALGVGGCGGQGGRRRDGWVREQVARQAALQTHETAWSLPLCDDVMT